MNSEFLANIRTIFGSDGEAWLTSLPHAVDQLRQAWELHNIAPVADLTYNYCFFAESKDGQKFVAKIAPKRDTHCNEVMALQSFLVGVPKVFAVSSEHQAYLMERFISGTSAKMSCASR